MEDAALGPTPVSVLVVGLPHNRQRIFTGRPGGALQERLGRTLARHSNVDVSFRSQEPAGHLNPPAWDIVLHCGTTRKSPQRSPRRTSPRGRRSAAAALVVEDGDDGGDETTPGARELARR